MSRIALLAACAVVLVMPASLFAQAQTTTTRTETTVTRTAPPAPMAETIPDSRPYTDAVWIPGYYKWDGSAYHWMQGHWDRPPVAAEVWVAGHWDQVGDGWQWTEGHWSGQ